ncbi:MAG: hypothetical protein ABW137_28820 [Mycobacterium sp.]
MGSNPIGGTRRSALAITAGAFFFSVHFFVLAIGVLAIARDS